MTEKADVFCPTGWRLATLPELIGDEGVYVDGDWVETIDQDRNGEVRLIQLADIGEGEFIDKSARFLTAEKAIELRCTDLKPGDILVARMPDPIGRACVFPGLDQRCVTVVDVCIIRPDTRLVDPAYLCRVINSSVFRRSFAKYVVGTTRPRISRSNLSKVAFPLPPLAEQKRIAAILDKADAIRRRRQEAARLADTLIPSVFYEMFGDARTNRHKWPMRKFSEVCESRLGKMLDGKQQTGEHRRPYLGNANVQWFRFDLANLKDMDFDEFDRAEFRLQAGDVLICEGGEVGRAAVWRDELPECYFQKAIHRARPYPKKATPEYIAWLMRDLAQHGGFDLVTSQATIAHLTGEKLKGLPIPVPPFPLQEQFSKKVRELEAFAKVQRLACDGLDNLFNALVQRAFRGEL